MRTYFKHVLFGLVTLLVMSCNTSKTIAQIGIEENHPFKVIKATYNTWVGGQPGVKGLLINIFKDNPEIKLDTVYFRNMKVSLKQNFTSEKPHYVGSFTYSKTKPDYILHENAINEYGNTSPNTTLKIPFKLKEDEAVVSYFYKEKIHYCKIENIEKVKSNSPQKL